MYRRSHYSRSHLVSVCFLLLSVQSVLTFTRICCLSSLTNQNHLYTSKRSAMKPNPETSIALVQRVCLRHRRFHSRSCCQINADITFCCSKLYCVDVDLAAGELHGMEVTVLRHFGGTVCVRLQDQHGILRHWKWRRRIPTKKSVK
jgi:hypothetical protein